MKEGVQKHSDTGGEWQAVGRDLLRMIIDGQ